MAGRSKDVKFEVSPELISELSRISLNTRRAVTIATRETIEYAEVVARALVLEESGTLWKNDTGNLSKTITGYVAGDPTSEVYRYASDVEVPKAGDSSKQINAKTIGNSGSETTERVSIKNTQSYLDRHYKVRRTVSPPVAPTKNTIVGVLHKYMQYAPYVQSQKGSALTQALEKPEVWTRLITALERELGR